MIYWVIYTGVYTNNAFSTCIMRGLKILEVVQLVKLKVQYSIPLVHPAGLATSGH